MRDQHYELTAAPGTFRVAITGPSFVMGSGVSDEEVFEAVLEGKLNRDLNGRTYDKYEILNFGIAGYTAIQELYQLENDILQFKPDVVIWVGHHLETQNVIRYLADRVSLGIDIPYEEINQILAKAGAKPGMAEEEIGRLLRPYGKDIVAWTYGKVVEYSREYGFAPVWIYLPVYVGTSQDQIEETLFEYASEAGFYTVDLSTVYDGQDLDSITVAEWDRHPNGRGNRLIAEGLYNAITSNEELATIFGTLEK
jgi:hypothetical protein